MFNIFNKMLQPHSGEPPEVPEPKYVRDPDLLASKPKIIAVYALYGGLEPNPNCRNCFECARYVDVPIPSLDIEHNIRSHPDCKKPHHQLHPETCIDYHFRLSRMDLGYSGRRMARALRRGISKLIDLLNRPIFMP